MCRSSKNVFGIGLLVLALGIGLATPIFAAPEANTCNGNSEISYPTAPNFVAVGDIVRIHISLGAGGIQGGTTLTVNRVRFNDDCDASQPLGINCSDDQAVVSYQGNITTNCPSVTWSPCTDSLCSGTVAPNDTLPNQVVFTPSTPIAIGSGVANFCQLEFDVRVESRSNDTTPNDIEEVSGFDASLGDGVCNTTPALAAGNTNSGSIHLCPVCDDADPCTTDSCDSNTGCVNTPGALNCNDNDPCTSDACVTGTGCVNTPGALNCDDKDPCTSDACVTGTGCVNTPGALNCDDNDPCTSDACVTGTGCVNTPGALNCDDNDVCTSDSCVAGTGCVNTPGALNCDDKNVCTKDSCDPIDGCVHNDTTSACDDGDPCTDDSCDPVEGCVNTPNDACSLTCRTPGFWGTHADNDPGKNCSQDVTAAVLALNGGTVSVCGECIHNSNTGETLAPGDAAGALEALCVKVQGQQTRQLTRQLLSAALNCIMSGVGGTCAGTNVIDWATCNAVCQGTSSVKTVGQCITEIDNFNNGIGTGCHDRALPLNTIFPNGTRCVDGSGQPKLGAAGSSSECNAARGNTCTTIQPNEANCATDSCP